MSLDTPYYEELRRRRHPAANWWIIGDLLYYAGLFGALIGPLICVGIALTQGGGWKLWLAVPGAFVAGALVLCLGSLCKALARSLGQRDGIDAAQVYERDGRPLYGLITRLRRQAGLTVSDEAQAWVLRIPKQEGLVFTVTIPRDVLEWFVDVHAGADKMWADWMDHYPAADQETIRELHAQRAAEIEAFVFRLLAVPVRLVRQEASPKGGLEWQVNDAWKAISLREGDESQRRPPEE